MRIRPATGWVPLLENVGLHPPSKALRGTSQVPQKGKAMATRKAVRDRVVRACKTLHDARKRRDQAKADADEAQDRGIEAFRELGATEMSFHSNGLSYKGVLVEPTKTVFSEDKIEKRVSQAVWQRITRRVLDKDLMAQAVAEGLLDLSKIADCVEEVPGTPYIKVSTKES